MLRVMSQQDSSWYLIRRLAGGYLPQHKAKLIISGLAMLVVSGCMSLIAYYIQPLFDAGLIDKRIGVLNTVVIALIGLTIIKGVAHYIQGYFMEYVGQRLISDLQGDLFTRLINQDLAFFFNNPTATLTSRFISDLQRLRLAVTQIFHRGFRDTAVIIGLTANMLWQDWALTLLALVTFPLSVLPIKYFGRMMRRYSRLNQESTGKLAHFLNQSLGHARQVQSFTMESHESIRAKGLVETVFSTAAKAARIRALSSPIVEFIGTLAIGAIMLYAGRRITDGTLTPGEFASIMASVVMIVRPLKGITNLNNILQEGLAAAKRTYEVMDAAITIQNTEKAQALSVTTGEILFKDVEFIYPDGTVALTKLNLMAPAGQTIALVGPSGAGKSTILNLIPRFFDPAQGQIMIDGQDIKNVTLNSLRSNIALVSQDVVMFDDSIRTNIAFGNPNANEQEIIQAAKDAAAHEFIMSLPNGYATMVGEDGVKLSGGQKQRLAIARALIKNAPILLLDEATSNLDTESERQVQTALEKLMRGRTTVVIAHRLSTVVGADVIHVLEDGNIVESGQHKNLLAQQGLYANLWQLQSQGKKNT